MPEKPNIMTEEGRKAFLSQAGKDKGWAENWSDMTPEQLEENFTPEQLLEQAEILDEEEQK